MYVFLYIAIYLKSPSHSVHLHCMLLIYCDYNSSHNIWFVYRRVQIQKIKALPEELMWNVICQIMKTIRYNMLIKWKCKYGYFCTHTVESWCCKYCCLLALALQNVEKTFSFLATTFWCFIHAVTRWNICVCCRLKRVHLWVCVCQCLWTK